MFLGSRRNPCYFWDLKFCEIGYSCYSCDICKWLSHKIFRCEKCEENLLTRSILDISQFFAFSVLFALPRHTIQTAKQGRRKLNLTTIWYWSVLDIAIASALYVYTKSHTHIPRYLKVVQRDVQNIFFLNISLSLNVQSRNNRQQLLSCNTNNILSYNFLGKWLNEKRIKVTANKVTN